MTPDSGDSGLVLSADEWTAAREVALWYLANTEAAVVPRRGRTLDPELAAELALCERIVEATSQGDSLRSPVSPIPNVGLSGSTCSAGQEDAAKACQAGDQ